MPRMWISEVGTLYADAHNRASLLKVYVCSFGRRVRQNVDEQNRNIFFAKANYRASLLQLPFILEFSYFYIRLAVFGSGWNKICACALPLSLKYLSTKYQKVNVVILNICIHNLVTYIWVP